MQDTQARQRRFHEEALKRQVLEECAQPGTSVARIALMHGLNANLVHRWRRLARRDIAVAPVKAAPIFVPVSIAAPPPAADIRIELQRGPVSVTVNWPAAAIAECGAWLREILR
jgi:transposase